MRLIDADALETHEWMQSLGNGKYDTIVVVYKDDIDNMPSIDAEPVRRGRWITQDGYVCCSECGDDWGTEKFDEVMSFNYCPNCGAKMDGERKEK